MIYEPDGGGQSSVEALQQRLKQLAVYTLLDAITGGRNAPSRIAGRERRYKSPHELLAQVYMGDRKSDTFSNYASINRDSDLSNHIDEDGKPSLPCCPLLQAPVSLVVLL
jgi:hypothetical protein